MKRISLLFFSLFFSGGLLVGITHLRQTQPPITPLVSVVPTPSVIPYGIPKTISIPRIKVDATVESVAMDNKGRMDVPKDFNDVGWYSLGVKPGEAGNAVVDGHVNTPQNVPAVFANLTALKPGDPISITDDKGQSLTFSVTDNREYTLQTLPLAAIFGPANTPNLILITCSGVWDRAKKEYQSRVVVYATMISSTKRVQ